MNYSKFKMIYFFDNPKQAVVDRERVAKETKTSILYLKQQLIIPVVISTYFLVFSASFPAVAAAARVFDLLKVIGSSP